MGAGLCILTCVRFTCLYAWNDGKRFRGTLREDGIDFQELVEWLPAVVYVVASGVAAPALYVSPRVESMLGYAQDEWLSKPGFWAKLLYPGDRERTFAEAIRAREAGEPFRIEYRMVAKDGCVIWVRDEATPVLDEEASPKYWRGVLLDITERKEAEEALKESENRFRAIFEAADVGMAHISPDGRWRAVNGNLCEMLGYGREELLAMTFWEMTLTEELEDSQERISRLLEGKLRSYAVERRYICKDGRRVWANVSISLARKFSGEPDYFFCKIEDITTRKLGELVPDPLTSGEIEVLRLVSEGCVNHEIADELRYSVGNIKHRVQRIIVKLGVENRRQAATKAVDIGLIPPPY